MFSRPLSAGIRLSRSAGNVKSHVIPVSTMFVRELHSAGKGSLFGSKRRSLLGIYDNLARRVHTENMEFNSKSKIENVIVDVNRPVFTNYFPFNVFYAHNSEYVLPLDPKDPGYSAGKALASLAAIFVIVFGMWQLSSAVPVTNETSLQPISGPEDMLAILQELTPDQLSALARKTDWMTDNFTVNRERIITKPWTIVTASFSHQDQGHMLGNFFALFQFMPKVYAFLGPRHTLGQYLAGALGCSLGHAGMNTLTHRTERPFGFLENVVLSTRLNEEQLDAAMRRVDVPALGASGSVMAIATASALLFPRDRVFMRMFYMPISIAALMYIGSDLFGILGDPGSSVAHAGHLGGVAAGALYILTIWYSKLLGPLAPYARYRADIPLKEFLRHRSNPLAVHFSRK